MAEKDKYIRYRVDEELKKALEHAAEHADRKEADHVRHLLRVALGLKPDTESHPMKHATHDSKKKAG